MPNEIAKAYVQIIPTTKGIGQQLESELGINGNKIGTGVGKSFVGSLSKALMGTAAITGAVKGIKDIIGNYADYEQLAGGVETLFGTSADTIMEYAQSAYKTAGLSANEYMETVTGFSASLLQSLDGDTSKAASAADLAITDMADNANKMGSSMESIQNAYQGFAKQNYTMLDNLKLGYGGTKEEMQRLLADAEAFSGIHYDISSLSDVYEAIHVVQTEMGITGTTALEASTTISGSSASMKSAWQNLLTGMADENANFDVLVSDFVNSLVTYADNLAPRIGIAMDGVGHLLTAFAETVLPNIISYITDNLPQIIETGVNIVVKLAEGLISALPQIAAATPEIIRVVVKAIVGLMPELLDAGVQIVNGIWEGIKSMRDAFFQSVKGFFAGIVDGVKDMLGIHSPSRVFADIGHRMAEGLGVGFGDEIGAVKSEIESDMRGITTGIEASSLSVNASATSGPDTSMAGFASAIVNGIATAVSGIGGQNEITLVTPDGSALARWIFSPLANYAKANGTPIINTN